LEKTPISEVCEKHQITPTQFYQWQKTFSRTARRPSPRRPGGPATGRATCDQLEDKLKRKDEVIAEIIAEHILLKKVLGKAERELGRP